MGGDVEGAAVIAPTAVASILVCENGAKVFAGRTEHEDASGTGSPDVTLRVHLQSVARASATLAAQRFGIEEGAAVSHGAVGLHFVGHNSRVTRVADGDVEGLLVRGEGNAVGPREVGNQQGHFAFRIHAIDAVMWQLL